ncbi:phosphatase PAP2 family protein [Roseobacter sp. YSTF-M11]|uniref:Phosphatase PAP2 family protein n=1 Tax=Roseobacter insulae TaxID=2859783 RepID=A0A9X1JZE4_9RHOB|nr:phosphatase PAP2 family protein [Roseobacter insulae]MBW4707099.1 phosphatase PAP2 family protein [Roseobacter insulae]
MSEWPVWARGYVIQSDLLAGMVFETAPKDGIDFQVSHLGAGILTEGKTTYESEPLFSFRRPRIEDFKEQLDYVNTYAELRMDRSAEILSQTGYPEHFFGVILGLHPSRTKYSLELMATAQLFATGIAQRVKHALACKRPDMFSSQIQPMIPMPGHGTLPSGHATEAFTVARVMSLLIDDRDIEFGIQDQLMHQAERISINRTIAGVHFPADSIAGAMLGLGLGEYFVARGRGLGPGAAGPYTETTSNFISTAHFDGTVVGNEDFRMRTLFDKGQRQSLDAAGRRIVELGAKVNVVTATECLPLTWLWEKAKAEWPDRRAADM